MTEGGANVPVVIAVDPDRFDEVAAALAGAGVSVERELREIGTIGGHVAEGRLASLEALAGVLAVDRERVVQLPPPDADLQ